MLHSLTPRPARFSAFGSLELATLSLLYESSSRARFHKLPANAKHVGGGPGEDEEGSCRQAGSRGGPAVPPELVGGLTKKVRVGALPLVSWRLLEIPYEAPEARLATLPFVRENQLSRELGIAHDKIA